MNIKPLRDILVAVPCEQVGKVGALWMPDNTLQSLRTHRKMLVLAAGPLAKEQGIDSGVVIHARESWGEEMPYGDGKKAWVGRSRDINGICEGEAINDTFKYMD